MQRRIVLAGILSLMAAFTACVQAGAGEQQHNQSQAGQLTQAKPVTVELRFDIKNGEPGLPNEYTKLIFADGSNRYVALVRRSGKVVSEGMLRGATAQEWGFHEVTLGPETNGLGTGYLVITQAPATYSI